MPSPSPPLQQAPSPAEQQLWLRVREIEALSVPNAAFVAAAKRIEAVAKMHMIAEKDRNKAKKEAIALERAAAKQRKKEQLAAERDKKKKDAAAVAKKQKRQSGHEQPPRGQSSSSTGNNATTVKAAVAHEPYQSFMQPIERLTRLWQRQEAARTAAGRERPPILSAASFRRHSGVVVATKIHGHAPGPAMVKQWLCLFTAAYNQLARYDIVVFTTVPIADADVRSMKRMAQPARLSVAIDLPGSPSSSSSSAAQSLADLVRGFPTEKRNNLLSRCNATLPEEITWFSRCCEPESIHGRVQKGAISREHAATCARNRLNYGWQAEFRSRDLWTHPAIAPYDTMLWMDADAFCTAPWRQDPIDLFIERDLVLLFDNILPARISSGNELPYKLRQGLGEEAGRFCIVMPHTLYGRLNAKRGCDQSAKRLPVAHGFMHVTNLRFYREARVQKWVRAWIGEEAAFARTFDDQAAVTVAAAAFAPHRAWDMWSHGVTLNVMHNAMLDGKVKVMKGPSASRGPGGPGFQGYWNTFIGTPNSTFPDAQARCAREMDVAQLISA